MTDTHTPGPWTIDGVDYIDIISPAGRIAMLDSDAGLPGAQEMANARLIASAPALLEALRAMLAKHDQGREHLSDLWPAEAAAARAALALAQGLS